MEAIYHPNYGSGPLRAGEVPTFHWDNLMRQGWRGNPNDRMEAIYKSPAGREQAPPILTGARGGSRGGDVHVNITGPVYGADSRQLALGVRDELARMKRQGVALGFV